MRCNIISSEMIDDKRRCLHPYRYTGSCYKCDIFKRKLDKLLKEYDDENIIISELKKMDCKPMGQYKELIHKKIKIKKLYNEIVKLKEEIKNIEE